ncbi:hypothetical protein UVIVOLLU_CDS0085 [Salmonella phage PHA46_2]
MLYQPPHAHYPERDAFLMLSRLCRTGRRKFPVTAGVLLAGPVMQRLN